MAQCGLRSGFCTYIANNYMGYFDTVVSWSLELLVDAICHKCNACSSKEILGPQSLGPFSPWVLFSPQSLPSAQNENLILFDLCTTSRATILLMYHSIYCLLAQLHCKNNLVVLTRVVTMVADKLKKWSS